MNSSQLFLILIATLGLIWIIIYTLSKSRRAKQWIMAATLTGMALGPLYVLMTDVTAVDNLTLLQSPLSMLEVGLVSGLGWGIFSTIILSRQSGAIKSPVKLNLKKILLSYIVLAAGLIAANALSISPQLTAIAILGIASLIVAMQNHKLLLTAVMTMGVALIISLIVAFGIPTIMPLSETSAILNINGLDSLLSIQDVALLGVAAIAAVIIPHWWFGQPLSSYRDNS